MPTDVKIWKLNVKNRSVCIGYCKLCNAVVCRFEQLFAEATTGGVL